jgi:signal transduction histidine kinase
VWSDPVLLERILRNLVSNAIRNTETGEIALVGHEREGKLLIEVQDTGIGISADHQARIFDEFYQIAIPGRSNAKGLGLGLSIVKRLCDLLGYPIRVSSRVGGGFDIQHRGSARHLERSCCGCASAPRCGRFDRKTRRRDRR